MDRPLDLRRGRPCGQGRPVGCDRRASLVGLLVLAGHAGLLCYGLAVATGTVTRHEWPAGGTRTASAPPAFQQEAGIREVRALAPPHVPSFPLVPPSTAIVAVTVSPDRAKDVPLACPDLRPFAREIRRRFGRGITVLPEGGASAEAGCGGYSVRAGRRSREVARYLGRRPPGEVRRDGDGTFHIVPARGRQASLAVPGLEP